MTHEERLRWAAREVRAYLDQNPGAGRLDYDHVRVLLGVAEKTLSPAPPVKHTRYIAVWVGHMIGFETAGELYDHYRDDTRQYVVGTVTYEMPS